MHLLRNPFELVMSRKNQFNQFMPLLMSQYYQFIPVVGQFMSHLRHMMVCLILDQFYRIIQYHFVTRRHMIISTK